MRPIERGSIPSNPETNTQITFTDYRKVKQYLLERIGAYCCYCEKHLTQLIDVEHILPKTHYPQVQNTWYNFLIACRVCNDIKGHSQIKRKDYYWSDADNTFRMFSYDLNNGAITVNLSLSATEQEIAQNTLNLVGLDRKPGHTNYKDSSADWRWRERLDVLGVAKEAIADLQNHDIPEMRNQIVRNAQARGFWSVWMTVFKDDPDMLNRFIETFPGTCQECFDSLGKPVPRPRGRL